MKKKKIQRYEKIYHVITILNEKKMIFKKRGFKNNVSINRKEYYNKH